MLCCQYYTSSGLPSRKLEPGVCAVCGNKIIVLDNADAIVEKTYQLTCDHMYLLRSPMITCIFYAHVFLFLCNFLTFVMRHRERKCADSLGWPFPVLNYKYIFSNKIYRSNFVEQQSETVVVWNYQNAHSGLRKQFNCVICCNFWHSVISYCLYFGGHFWAGNPQLRTGGLCGSSCTTHMPLLTATRAFGLAERCQSSHQYRLHA